MSSANKTITNDLFKMLVDAVKDYAIFMLDLDGYILTWNSGAERIKGYTNSEIIGQHFSCFYSKEDTALNLPNQILKIAQENGKFEGEGWRVRKDGSRFWANIIITAMHDKTGNLMGFSKVTRDLTERKKNEEQLEQQVKDRTMELAKAVQVRDEFLCVASHELKTPLTGLRLKAQMRIRKFNNLTRETFHPHHLVKMFQEDIHQLDRLNRLIDDMLSVRRISMKNIRLQKEEIELGPFVLEIIKNYERELQLAGCSLAFDAEKIYGRWDSDRLEQVFVNILSNAMKYAAGKPIKITIKKMDNHALAIISDEGMGISKKDLQRIFLPYERAVSGSISGLGLGLYIVKQIILAHNGEIAVQSKENVGTTFTIKIPLGT